MKIVYFGSGQFGINCLDALIHSEHSIELVVSQPARSSGRGRKPTPTPVASWALTQSIPLIETGNVNDPDIVKQIIAARGDLILVIAFGQKISNELTELPPKSAINVHSSLLPKYRGAAPINWAIINGETETGISIITVAQKMDAGQILAQSKTPIGPSETAGELHDRLAQLSAPLLLETLDKIANGAAIYTEQDHSKATLAPKLAKSDGKLDFADNADSILSKILGLWPWPGASTNYISNGTDKTTGVTIAMAEIIMTSNPEHLPPGTLDAKLNVICGRNALNIKRIKPQGSRLMDFKAFVNGRGTKPGDMFKSVGG